jgi:hypothetical protein
MYCEHEHGVRGSEDVATSYIRPYVGTAWWFQKTVLWPLVPKFSPMYDKYTMRVSGFSWANWRLVENTGLLYDCSFVIVVGTETLLFEKAAMAGKSLTRRQRKMKVVVW